MGQAWCKEKSTKAQDSKSPLDRVFVRCAHRIYPGLKEEGSVLGGATQRVTSSEIGYAGSPTRVALQRGQSIDSVDRPFHPSEWVDVNLEVPCTPGPHVLASAHQQRSSNLPKANGSMSPQEASAGPATAAGAPVPPPRRRRRRERRPLPPKPGGAGSAADDESEPEPLYSQLAAPRSEDSAPPDDSADEFVLIEEMLKRRSLEDLAEGSSRARPKNHSTTSLPNVAQLLQGGVTVSAAEAAEGSGGAAAERPPRHGKAASLPRTPERTFFPGRIVEVSPSQRTGSTAGDNSIAKEKSDADADADAVADAAAAAAAADCSSLSFEADVKTSTPVKPPVERDAGQPGASTSASQNLDDVFESFSIQSRESEESSAAVVGPAQDVDRPQSPMLRNVDAGYVSRSSSHFLFNGSHESERTQAEDEPSSGIIRDATGDSLALPREEDSAEEGQPPRIQRTISEESLPREMLVDELEEVEEEEEEALRPFDADKSAKDASNEITRQSSVNGNDSFRTPPPSPEDKSRQSEHATDGSDSRPAVNGDAGLEVLGKKATVPMTPSLLELEAALSEMLDKKDEAEREAAAARGEPRIVPVHKPREDAPEERTERPRSAWLIDPRRPERTNPFDDLPPLDSSGLTDDPPEKPSRLHRSGTGSEEGAIEEPLLVPTPPRRRHRSKSNLNSSGECAAEAIHAATQPATLVDRLI